jgi:hypothetical protein
MHAHVVGLESRIRRCAHAWLAVARTRREIVGFLGSISLVSFSWAGMKQRCSPGQHGGLLPAYRGMSIALKRRQMDEHEMS